MRMGKGERDDDTSETDDQMMEGAGCESLFRVVYLLSILYV